VPKNELYLTSRKYSCWKLKKALKEAFTVHLYSHFFLQVADPPGVVDVEDAGVGAVAVTVGLLHQLSVAIAAGALLRWPQVQSRPNFQTFA